MVGEHGQRGQGTQAVETEDVGSAPRAPSRQGPAHATHAQVANWNVQNASNPALTSTADRLRRRSDSQAPAAIHSGKIVSV